ncbi:MAG: SDR family oxidoreductase [Dehalococcoidia bacterium]|nr:SDR family oxidoreductase [Dehalococcoidia bacterium]
MSLAGKTALITGAGQNLGKAMALEMARQGANIVVNTRSNVAQAEAVQREIEALGARAMVALADVGDEAQVQRMARNATQVFGGVDILVCSAANRGGHDKEYTDSTIEEWRAVHRVILEGAFFLTRAVLPHMTSKQWGRILFLSGYGPFNHKAAALSTAKFGLNGLCEALARGYGAHGVLVNVLSPGVMETVRDPSRQLRPDRTSQIPVGHLGSPQDFAKFAAFLCSPENSFVTGETIMVNGGQVMPA